jgi:hypothetical protein
MLVLGSLLALASGMLMALAAALEKYEGMRTALTSKGFALLAALSRRPLWVVGILASALGWVVETASLVLAPVPVVATLRNAGRGVLVPFGRGWLAERFGRAEMTGIVLTILGGAITAFGASGAATRRQPLGDLTLLEVAAGCAVFAAIVAEVSRRIADDLPGGGVAGTNLESPRSKAAGIAAGAAVGVLFAGTGIYSKEIGDRIALHGLFGGVGGAFVTPDPYLMVASTIWAQSILQQAFRRANAASVASANASVASTGLIAAGFALYGQHTDGTIGRIALFGGIVVATLGTIMLAASRPPVQATLASVELDGAATAETTSPEPARDGPAGDGPARDGPAGDGPAGDGPAGDGPAVASRSSNGSADHEGRRDGGAGVSRHATPRD